MIWGAVPGPQKAGAGTDTQSLPLSSLCRPQAPPSGVWLWGMGPAAPVSLPCSPPGSPLFPATWAQFSMDHPHLQSQGPAPRCAELAFETVISSGWQLDSIAFYDFVWFVFMTFSFFNLLGLYILMCGQRSFGKRHVLKLHE